ncbi:MAG: hypothetical protein E4H27_07370, partial [Anaerolineales bacterium]
AQGHSVCGDVNSRIVGLTLDQIRAIPRVICLAGSAEKYEVIRAALRGRLVHVLITDMITAHHLLEEKDQDAESGY